jgi:hypothetical protein
MPATGEANHGPSSSKSNALKSTPQLRAGLTNELAFTLSSRLYADLKNGADPS